MSNTTFRTAEVAQRSAASEVSTDQMIAMFKAMRPSKEVLMAREMEIMFLSISDARKLGVSEQQAIAGLKLRWPGAHTASIIKLFNAELERRLRHGEQVECKPFGKERKRRTPKTRAAESRSTTSQNEAEDLS